jgi:hypothetical protein
MTPLAADETVVHTLALGLHQRPRPGGPAAGGWRTDDGNRNRGLRRVVYWDGPPAPGRALTQLDAQRVSLQL